MDLQTFYLKYRPQRFSELDSTDARESLIRTFKSGTFPHAFLLSGPKGIGKTSAARLVAKAVNCLHPKKGEPCNRCSVCREITAGTAIDLIEIDAASNRGIDDIRDLKEKIKLSPAVCHYKVYIIDEVHMLTNEAFNALLKTLEEPPAHALFILCTTAPEKLPPTIISRCTRFNFKKASTAEIVKSLERVVKGEKLFAEKGVLSAISISCFVDGSFRDAHKILEQLSLGQKEITLLAAQNFLGQNKELSVEILLDFLARRKVKPAFKEIDRVVQQGADLIIYTQNILNYLRQSLISKIGIGEENELSLLSLEEIKKLIILFSKAFNELKSSPIPQLVLELVVVEYCCPNEVQRPPVLKQNKPVPTGGFKQIEEKWPTILAKVKPLNHSIEALLRTSRPINLEDKTLTLQVFYKFHKERLDTEKCRRIVEEVVSQVLDQPIKLRCILGQRPALSEVEGPANEVIKKAQEIFLNQ